MTRSHGVVRVLAGALALGLTLSLAACSKDKPDLPSVGGATVGGAGGGDLEAIATKFYDCLKAAGLPVEFGKDTKGRSTIVNLGSSVKAFGVDPEGWSFTSLGTTEDEQQDFFKGRNRTKPILQVDGVDRTDVWMSCYDESGYSVSAIMAGIMDSPVGQSFFSFMVDSSNEWAKCARENGFPETKDAMMPSRYDFSQVPMALLPPSITEPQLTDLLTKCPNFDAEQQKKNDELMNKVDKSDPTKVTIPDGVVFPPNVGFDYPGFNGISGGLTGAAISIPDDDTANKLKTLMGILSKPADDYEAGKAQSAQAPSATP